MATATMQSSDIASMPTNKRKREPTEQTESGRSRRSQNTNGEAGSSNDEDFAIHQQILQNIGGQNGLQGGDSTRTAQAALATPTHQSTYPPPDTSFDTATGMPHDLSFDETGGTRIGSTAQALFNAREASAMNSNKPAVGTQQWHQQRKDNHKEVERRRRETINEGINEIAKIVPGTDKNKGSILQNAVKYIHKLQEKERSFGNERATFDIALKELSSRIELMRKSSEQAWGEVNKWQRRCREAGLQFDDYDNGGRPNADGEDDAAEE